MSTYTSYSDERLLVLLKESDDRAFTEIYNRYWRQVYATAFQFDKNVQNAEDIVQQVFLSFYEKRSSLDHIRSVSAYLAAAAKYKILDHCAKQKNRAELIKNNYHSPDNPILPDEELHARILQEFLRGKTEELPERTRIIFRYSREQMLSNTEIAQEMNISVKTVEAHLTTAIKTLRLSLNQLSNWLFTIVVVLTMPF